MHLGNKCFYFTARETEFLLPYVSKMRDICPCVLKGENGSLDSNYDKVHGRSGKENLAVHEV